jgi:hypothetical protein
MSHPIVQMFDSSENARAAAAALREAGFTRVHSVLGEGKSVAPVRKGAALKREAEAGASMSYDNVMGLMVMGNMLLADVQAYAEGVSRGKSLVGVHPAFGQAVRAAAILDQFGPVDSGPAQTLERLPDWDDAAPLSSMFGIPVLVRDSRPSAELSDNPAPLSSMFGIPLLSRPQSNWTSSFGFPLLSKPKSNWTSSFGLPLLTKRKSNWTSSFGLPLLSKSQSSWTSSFGLPLLSRNAAPLSALFNIPVLIRDRWR